MNAANDTVCVDDHFTLYYSDPRSRIARADVLFLIRAELTEPDEIFREDFTVRFAGLEVDHKYLVGALVLGQAVGFVGSAVGGNEARKKGEQVAQLNQKLLKVNAELRREMREAGIGPYQPIPASRFIEKSVDSTDEDDETVARVISALKSGKRLLKDCLLYTSPSPRDATLSRMPSSA